MIAHSIVGFLAGWFLGEFVSVLFHITGSVSDMIVIATAAIGAIAGVRLAMHPRQTVAGETKSDPAALLRLALNTLYACYLLFWPFALIGSIVSGGSAFASHPIAVNAAYDLMLISPLVVIGSYISQRFSTSKKSKTLASLIPLLCVLCLFGLQLLAA